MSAGLRGGTWRSGNRTHRIFSLQQKQRESKKRNHNSASAQMQLYVPAVWVWHGTARPARAWHMETGTAVTQAPSTGGGGYWSRLDLGGLVQTELDFSSFVCI